MTELELLAPAKNLECGIAAIDHGADAVYIGAPRFGARAAAANSLEDIKKLCDYAHQFRAKVHVTVNTIIYENEMEDTLKMIGELDRIGVDALLLQDMGVLWDVRANQLWHRELHSSTQCDARSADKVFWLSTLGFDRVVLARELSLDEIRKSTGKILLRSWRSLCMVRFVLVIRVYAMLRKNVSPVLQTVVNVLSSAE